MGWSDGGSGRSAAPAERQRRRLVEVSDHHRRRVVRVVEGLVELPEARGRDLLDVAAPADRRVMVRVLAERGRERVLVEDLERRVLSALELVAHDGHLGDAVLVAQQRAAHAGRLDPHGDLERGGRERLVVVRAVEPRRGVESRAERLEHGRDRGALGALELGRALEHQVLEQVRRARVAHRLVAAAHVVDDRERRDRRDAVREQEDAQPVGAHPELAEAGLLLDELERVARRCRVSGLRVSGGPPRSSGQPEPEPGNPKPETRHLPPRCPRRRRRR